MLCGLTAGAAGKSSNRYRDANVLAFCLVANTRGGRGDPPDTLTYRRPDTLT